MGTIYWFSTGTEQDIDTRGWYKVEHKFWYVFCDKCESFRVVPTGYRVMGTGETTSHKRTLFHGLKTVTETYDIYTREFTCKDCGSITVIQLDEITGSNRLSPHQVPHLMSKIYELEARAQDEARKISKQRNRGGDYDPESLGEARGKVGFAREYKDYDLLLKAYGNYQRFLNDWSEEQKRYSLSP